MLSMLAGRIHTLLDWASAGGRCERGNISLLFGITLVPLVGLVGFAVDYGNAYRMRGTLQSALDAAALAGGRVLELTDDDVKAKQSVDDALAANIGSKIPGATHTTSINKTTGMVVVTGSANVATILLPIIQVNSVPIGATSQIKTATKTFEIALVLDTSGSMGQPASKLASLKTAANNLTGILFDPNVATGRVKMGVVPFAASVNVDRANAGAAWMDTTKTSPVHCENFDSPCTYSRQQLFAKMPVDSANKPLNWGGCVEVRKSPHDVTDSTPSSGTPDSLFVPMFAPDEPDSGASSYFYNNYVADDKGNCPKKLTGTAQGRFCKYDGGSVKPIVTPIIDPSDPSTVLTTTGPNWGCDSSYIAPLTGTKSVITTAVGNLVAAGSTNIEEGLMWGWRVLSPTAPFIEGRPYTDTNNTKIMVLMTDGDNTHLGLPNVNDSIYHAFGYAIKGRLRAATNNTSLLKAAMDSKTTTACANAKTAGVTIYTVAFGASVSAATQSMLSTCATDAAHAYAPSTESALISAFEEIGRQISELRIAG